MLQLLHRPRMTAAAGTFAVTLLAILPSSPADAAGPFYDGNQFLQTCSGATYATYCGGYVIGTYDTALGGAASICLPGGAKDTQMLDVVLKYLRHNPADRAENAGTLVVDALSDAFPC